MIKRLAMTTLCLAVAGISTSLASPAHAANQSTYVASPLGVGTACSIAVPCSLPTALGRAVSGATVQLTSGVFRGAKTPNSSALRTASAPVTVRAVDPDRTTIAGLTTATPNVTWRGLTFTDQVRVDGTAVGTILDDVTVRGAGVFLRAARSVIRDSEISGGHDIDGIQIARADDAVVERTSVHDFAQQRGGSTHADCIQVFDSNRVTIRRNHLRDCYNAGLIVSVGSGMGIDRLTVESNFIQGCIVVSDTCSGGSAADLRESTATSMTVRNNSFASGSLRMIPLPGLVADRNLVSFLSMCDSPLTNTVVEAWNVKLCGTPSHLSSRGNRVGRPDYVDAATGDLRLRTLDSARISPFGTSKPAATSIDGAPLPADIAGAGLTGTPNSTPSAPPAPASPSAADTTPPTVTTDMPSSLPTAKGTVTIIADATDDRSVAKVSVVSGGRTMVTLKRGVDGRWRGAFDTRTVPNGTYAFQLAASDGAGNVGRSGTRTVTIAN